jgi:uncharacterized protein YndB with AHSA1/START domain
MTDTIESEVHIAAPIERVWDIITRPEHLGRWFGDAGAEQDGNVIRMRWEEHGEAELRVVRSEAPRVFAWRWDANIKAAETVREELREGNVGGWKHELGDLERYAQTVAV